MRAWFSPSLDGLAWFADELRAEYWVAHELIPPISGAIVITQSAPEAFVLTEQTGVVTLPILITQSAPEALVLTEQTGVVTLPILITQSAPEALVLTEQAGAVTMAHAITQSAPEALVLTEQAGVVTLPIVITQSAPEALVLTEQTGAVTLAAPPAGIPDRMLNSVLGAQAAASLGNILGETSASVVLNGQPIAGIFRPYFGQVADPRAPELYVRTVDLPAGQHGHAITVEGRVYTIEAVRPAAPGLCLLRLAA
jgi:hypothetical protein